MDKKKSVSASSSSSSSSSLGHLFGPRVSTSPSSSTTGLFQSIFPPPSTETQANLASRNEAAIYQPTNFGILNERGERSRYKERKSHQNEEIKQPPCNLSSSIYYGGQDNCSSSTTDPDTSKKDGEDGDSNEASRGNWWKGSLYY